MFKNIDDTRLEEPAQRAQSIDTKDITELKLAHELAHCLREQDTEKFIFIYDFKIPDTFDSDRLDRLKENSRVLSELNQTEFAKVCDDLKCEMEQNRIVKNEEYFRHKSVADSKDRIRYENEALVKKLLEDSDEESTATSTAFNLPKLTGQCSSMCRDGFVTNYRYQTYKDNKRNETQLTSCYDEVYPVKNNESDDVESEEKLSSSASSSISYRSLKNSDHVIINMVNDDDDHFGSFENKYKQQDEYLEELKNECKLGTTVKSVDNGATRSDMAYRLMAQCQMDRSNLNKSNQMKDDFNKTYDDDNEFNSATNSDSSQFLLNEVISKLVNKNNHKVSSLQFNNYNFDAYEKCDNKIGDSNDGSRIACKNDNLDSHGSSMTNSSKHEDEDEEKDDDYEMDFDQYFPDKDASKNDCLEKTIDELSTKHVVKAKKSLCINDSFEPTKTSVVKNVSTSAGFHQKYQNCAYFLNCANPEVQEQNKSPEDKSTFTKKSNGKKNQKKSSNNQNESKNNSKYSKHWTEDVDSLLEFITSTSIKSEQKPNKPKKQNTEISTSNNSKNTTKKNKKSETEPKQKPISPVNNETSQTIDSVQVIVEETLEPAVTKINDSNILPQIDQPNIDLNQDLPETEFVTVIKGKKIKKETKEPKEQSENTKTENLISNQTNNKKNHVNKSLEKHGFMSRKESIEKKSLPAPKTAENKQETITITANLETRVEKSSDIVKHDQLAEAKPSEVLHKSFSLQTDQKDNTLKKSLSTSSSKKTPVVFLDEMFVKTFDKLSLPLDIKFGLSTDEEDTVEKLVDPKTMNSDTDQTILVKKKNKLKRNKSARTASKQLDLIQNNYSSDSSMNRSTSCDENLTSSNKTQRKKSQRKKQPDTVAESEQINSQETEQSSSSVSYQGYYAQPFANQYQPYIIYQIDPSTNLPIALIPVNAYNISPQVNPEIANQINHLNQYYTPVDLHAYNYQLANYQYMQQFGQSQPANMVPMTYSVYVPPNGLNDAQNQVNVQSDNQVQRSVDNAGDNSRAYQNAPNRPNNYNLPFNYMHSHHPANYASYPSFANPNNNYIPRSSSYSVSNNHANSAGEVFASQVCKNENQVNENSTLSNKNVPNLNAKFKNPRYRNNAF